VVKSALAEEGKSSVASSLAAAMASAGRRTLLVEADLRRPVLAERLGVQLAPGLADYLAGAAAPQDTLRAVQFADAPPGEGASAWSADRPITGPVGRLAFIPAGSQTSRSAELLGSDVFKQFVEQVGQPYDVVVFDSSPLLPVSDTLEVLPCVDAAVLCVREGHTTLDQVSAARDGLSRFPHLVAGMVVTGIKPRSGSDDVAYAHTHQYS
jgi:Mrp family chromosome partitioning ATPase